LQQVQQNIGLLVMKKSWLIVLSFGLLMSCTPKSDFDYVNGESGFIKDYQEQWVLVNFWAEWCKPCLEEMPHINQFANKYRTKIKVIGVNFDKLAQSEQLVAQKKWNIKFPLAVNFPIHLLDIEMPAVLPANVIVSPSGEAFKPLLGPQTLEKLEAAFEKRGFTY
jgi:thiol-disulfide isomerase/thioredoxin